MTSIYVTIERRLTRTIRVDDAASLDAARQQIEAYGAIEAWSDYPMASEAEVTKIKQVAYPHPRERLTLRR